MIIQKSLEVCLIIVFRREEVKRLDISFMHLIVYSKSNCLVQYNE